jgi:glyoxylase I family protein
VTKAHHTAICTLDVDASLHFWRDGLGFEVTMDHEFDGDWPTLFEAPGTRLRSIFLGDPADPSAGTVELVDLGPLPEAAPAGAPTTGFFLVSVYLDVAAALVRLADLGLGGEPRRIEVHGVPMAVVRDPNGVRVELIGVPS